MEPILKSYFTNFKKQFEIVPNDQLEEAKAFERFVNYIIFSRDFPDIFTADVELLDAVSVGGGHDTGIDGLGIKVNDRVVRDKDEIKDIAEAARKVKVEFVFIQSKMRSGFDTSEFNTFGTGVKVFFSDGYLPENSQIGEFRELKEFILSDTGIISKLDANPSISVYYATTGIAPTDAHFLGAVEWLRKELTDSKNYYFDEVNIHLVDGKHLIRSCRELDNKFEAQINIIDIFPLIVASKTDVKKAYAFTCSAREFLKIVEKEDGSLRRALFNDNVRDYLGNRGAVNSEIEKTINESPELFLLRNNGITVVCSDFEQIRDKLVKIENPQIVNGCQTTNSIYNLRDHKNTEKLQLLVRLISTENLGVSNSIVRGTNKQNQVLDEAFEATLPFHQEALEPFFLAFDGHPRLYYERRAKQYNEDPLIKRSQVVNLRILTQTFVGMFLNAPHESHRHEAKLLEKYAGDEENRKIYKENQSPFPYYTCALTWYMFEKAFRDGAIDGRYRTYKSHLYLIFKYSVGLSTPPLARSRKIEEYCAKLIQALTAVQFDAHIEKVLKVFDRSFEIWTSTGGSRYGIKDNKEFTDLLRDESRQYFLKASTDEGVVEEEAVLFGKVLRVIFRHGIWFGFIHRGYEYENLYFDRRGYDQDVRDLLPGVSVKFEIATNERGDCATHVKIVH